MIEKVNLSEKFALFTEHWSPKIAGEVNDSLVKLVKFRGDFVWHKHETEDEMFYVVKGRITIRLRDGDIALGEGEFRVELRDRDAGPAGTDDVSFLIRPNRGLPFGPVAETASGGELSRIALAIAAVGGGETMVFDEIDAGIGGETAHRVAETLRRLAARAQVVTITHLPQIASVADRHFRVDKVAGDPTHTRIEPLDTAERRDELQRMLGGEAFLSSVRSR
jgi:DNA repair protein RecN (Recombination protein N)